MTDTAVFRVVVASGSRRDTTASTVTFPHRWTEAGVSVEAEFTGAHLLHLSAAGCVLNDVHREAQALGIDVAGVRVTAGGTFDTESWQSHGIEYTVDVDCPPERRDELLARVDAVAEIPKAIRAGAGVVRVDHVVD